MTRTLPAILLLALTAADAAGQGDGTVRIPGRFDRFTTDELGHVYALSGDELALYDMAGEQLQRNSVKTFGRITAISAYYSLKPMVFSAGQGRIAVLDNTLSVQGSIMDLPRLGFAQVVQACMSVQNGFWFFDERELALARFDAQLRPLAHSGRLDQVLGFAPQPQGMLEHDGRLYVNDAHEGILVFDLFGTYMRTIPLKGVTGFQVRGHQLFHFAQGGLWAYDMRSFATVPVPLPQGHGTVTHARVERGHVYALTEQGIVILPVPAR
ncbi:MAG: hypothetical protein RBT71_10370 [Flavobacteriales bacterium]|jgi:hypothetical protein|nr:hypothetical protein [Flavobacteriales bacterium]